MKRGMTLNIYRVGDEEAAQWKNLLDDPNGHITLAGHRYYPTDMTVKLDNHGNADITIELGGGA
jgi:hypothetical protein